MKKVIEWFKQSNRWKHLVGGFAVGLCAGILSSVIAGACLEYKDKAWGGKWDWIDFGLTVAGGIIGGVIHIIVI